MLETFLKILIPFLEEFQGYIDVEGYSFLGIAMDRYAHFFIAFLLTSVFIFFKEKTYGIIFTLSLIILKEVIDLGVNYYYEPITSATFLDTTIDLTIGCCGLISACFFFKMVALSSKKE